MTPSQIKDLSLADYQFDLLAASKGFEEETRHAEKARKQTRGKR